MSEVEAGDSKFFENGLPDPAAAPPAPPPETAAAAPPVTAPAPVAPTPVVPETAAERYAREAREANAADVVAGKIVRPKGGSAETWVASEAERKRANRPPTAEEYVARQKAKGRVPGKL